MKYTPAVIPADMSGTRAGILWAAANITVNEPDIDDAIAEAARRAGVHDEYAHNDADARAVEVAKSRVPTARLNPMWPSSKWATWQAAIDETWPILADAAISQESHHDREAGLEPGRWEA
ncbi:hypothetical protein GS896_25455 [Rhodococcus hoagii]|nr:hypothetical protein [Prescottella equi]MBM4654148.1 hypothetical protein [Prescottella equi]MBM4719621.1 hypothetical protein [Prescottella equi]NKR23419.1 hypothetical protein [Prescottella equi]NKT55969.1 hypothetical protein [Prescottella equi]